MESVLQKISYDGIKIHLQETAGLKHEIRNHLTAMRTYFEHGRLEEAKSYLDKYAVQAAAVTEMLHHDNFLVNAVAGNLLGRAAEHDIEVDLNLKAAPAHIADPDFYSLLTNITGNALEACKAMPEGGKRFINLTVSRRDPYLNIHCINSKSGEIISEGDRIQTTKTGDGHGYGLWTIRRIVDAYDGIMDVAYDENTFTLTAAIKDK